SLHVHTRKWPLGRQLLLHALLAPVLILLSYPGAFLCGATLLALLPAVWRAPRGRLWVAYAGWALVVLLAFVWLALGPARAQRCEQMVTCNLPYFPDWSGPVRAISWLVSATPEVLRYCFMPFGQFITPLVIVGALAWSPARRGLLVHAT